MNDSVTHACPDASTLAAFAEGTLDAVQRETVARHVADCLECPVIVGTVVRFLDEESADEDDAESDDEPPRVMLRSTRWIVAAAVVACIAMFWWIAARDSLARVNTLIAAQQVRPVEGMVHGFEHTAYAGARSAAKSARDPKVRAEAERLSRRSPTPEVLHARGVLALMNAEWRDAVRFLQDAAQRSPENPMIWNDLAAAEIALAAAGDREALSRSLASSERAIALSPSLAAPRFNRAIALEQLDRHQQALVEYRRALAATPPPLWRDEIAARIADLELQD